MPTLKDIKGAILNSVSLIPTCSQFAGMVPEHQKEYLGGLLEEFRRSLVFDRTVPSISSDDPFFPTHYPEGPVGKIVVRIDGVYALVKPFGVEAESSIRLCDPFDLCLKIYSLKDVDFWAFDNVEVKLRGTPIGEDYKAQWSTEDLHMDIVVKTGSGFNQSRKSACASFSRSVALECLDRVLPTIGRLIISEITGRDFHLLVEYRHNPKVLRSLGRIPLDPGKTPRETLRPLVGEVLVQGSILS